MVPSGRGSWEASSGQGSSASARGLRPGRSASSRPTHGRATARAGAARRRPAADPSPSCAPSTCGLTRLAFREGQGPVAAATCFANRWCTPCALASAARVGKHGLIRRPRWLAQPNRHHRSRVLAQRRAALLRPLPMTWTCAPTPNCVLAAKARELRQPQPGLNGEQHQRMVAAAGPGVLVRRCQQRIDLVAAQERHEVRVNRFAGIASTR